MPEQLPELPAAAIAALAKGRKIEAIKIVRQDRGIGLKEAKDAVESYAKTQPELANQSQSGAKQVLWCILATLAGGLLAYFFSR